MQNPQLLTCFEPIYVITTSAPAEALNSARQEGGILCPSLRGPIKPGAKASPAAWDRLARPGGGGSPPNCSVRSPGGAGRRPAYLTGSCRRWNQLQQLAISLSIPGSSLRLPSEPGAAMGPGGPGPRPEPPSLRKASAR